MKILSVTSTILAACVMLLTGAASASTLSARPSTLIFEGPITQYGLEQGLGIGFAFGSTTDALYLFDLSFVFDMGTPGENPRDVNLVLTDADTSDTALSAVDLEEVEIGAGFAAALLGDLQGPRASDFNGGKLLVILREPDFPAQAGNATLELRSLDPTTVIPLPAAAPLMLAGMSALVLVARRRTPAAADAI